MEPPTLAQGYALVVLDECLTVVEKLDPALAERVRAARNGPEPAAPSRTRVARAELVQPGAAAPGRVCKQCGGPLGPLNRHGFCGKSVECRHKAQAASYAAKHPPKKV
jgi:hypothetical protein